MLEIHRRFCPSRMRPFCFLADASPLFEEERNTRSLTLSANVAHPRGAHGSCSGATLSSHNDPVDPFQVQRSQMFQQRLNRKKSHLWPEPIAND